MSPLLIEARDLTAPEAWTAVAAIAAVILFAVRALRRGGDKRLSYALAALRLLAGALVLLTLLRPTAVVRRRAPESPMAVVVDASASMASADGGEGRSRWQAALDALRENDDALRAQVSPRFFRLDRQVSPLEGEKSGGNTPAPPRGTSSDFSKLSEAPLRAPGLKAVLFLTDGRHGGGPDPRAAWEALGVPVHTVSLGGPAAAADAAVESVRAAPFGFKNVPAEAVVRLRFHALPPGRARLSIWNRGRVVGSRWIDRADQEVLESTVSFQPSATGAETFEARLEPFPGEANVRNNAASFSMDVGRDRRRILYICGRPGPNYAYLRQQLKSDPTVELVTFVILRDVEDVLTAPQQELSLIPFPGQAELLEGLPSFDAVVFEDFSFQYFGLGADGMIALRSFVEKGGGFLLMGDAASFSPMSPYRGSALEPILPFRLDLPPVRGQARHRAAPGAAAPFAPVETAGGWTSLPPLEGNGLFPAAPRPGAAVILRAEAGGNDWPLAAVLSAGKGRVMGLSSLTTWRWALGGAADGGGPAAYVTFWAGALGWLTGDAEYRRVRLLPPAQEPVPGEELLIRVHARDDAQRPVADGEASYVLTEADGTRRSGPLHPAGDGEYAASAPLRAAGSARLEARVRRGGRLLGEDRLILSVGSSWDEVRDVSPDPARLQSLSEATGGSSIPLQAFSRAWVRKTLEPLAWETKRRMNLGENPWTTALLALTLLLEWVLRRRRGLP